MLIDLLFDDPVYYATIVGVVIVSIVLHELGHAFAATWEGDGTAKMAGHLTWNPVVHMGWMSMGLVAVFGIGWGSTPVSPRNFRHRRWGDTIVSFAGPAVHIVLALLSSAMAAFAVGQGASEVVLQFWFIATVYNVLLFFFNMLPVPPLDGFHVAETFFDMGAYGRWARSAGMMPLVLAIVLLNVLDLGTWAATISKILVGLWGLVLS